MLDFQSRGVREETGRRDGAILIDLFRGSSLEGPMRGWDVVRMAWIGRQNVGQGWRTIECGVKEHVVQMRQEQFHCHPAGSEVEPSGWQLAALVDRSRLSVSDIA